MTTYRKLYDDDRGRYAIEMEVGQDYGKEKINNIISKKYSYLGQDTSCLGTRKVSPSYESHPETEAILEINIVEPDFSIKSDIYKNVYTKDTIFFGRDRYTSGGCHLHYFFNNEGRSLVEEQSVYRTIARLLHNLPRFCWSNQKGLILRYGAFGRYEGEFRSRENPLGPRTSKRDIEFRCNNQIHPALFYYYDWIINKAIDHKNVDKVACQEIKSSYIGKLNGLSVFIGEEKNYSQARTSIHGIVPKLKYADIDLKLQAEQFIDFIEYISVYPEKELKENDVYGFFGEFFRNFPKEFKIYLKQLMDANTSLQTKYKVRKTVFKKETPCAVAQLCNYNPFDNQAPSSAQKTMFYNIPNVMINITENKNIRTIIKQIIKNKTSHPYQISLINNQ